jgi:DNA-binding IclR family transcriptional regulator
MHASNPSLVAEDLLRVLARAHLEGRRSDLDALTEEIGAPRAEVRGILSSLHREGYVDVLRMRLTLEGFAIGVLLLDEPNQASRPSLAA